MNRFARFLPFLRWFPLSGETVRADFMAGITVALVLIPQSMAYAQLAGMPAYYGLYAAFLPVAVAVMWGSSHQLGTGPVAVVSLLTASSLAVFAAPGSPDFIALAIMLALLVGVIQLLLGVFKLGVIVNFLSHPVIVGFTNAAAIIIGLSQVSKLFGVPMGRSEHFINDIIGVFKQVGHTHLPTLAMGILAIALMWGVKRYRPKWPGVLIAVAVTTTLSWGLGFAQSLGGQVVGSIPQGLPSLALPALDMTKLGSLLSAALVISLVGFMEAISIAKALAAKTKQRLDPNQELIGQGLSNIIGSLTQAFPVSGSFSRSAVNMGAGARTGMSSVFTAIFVLITLLFLTPLLYHLPQAVLAAVIIMAVIGLVNVKAVIHAWHAQKHDGIAAGVTFAATLAFAPHLDNGIMIGAGLALVLYLLRTMKPRVAILGRFPDGTLRDIKVNPGLPTSEHIVAMRFDGQLYFANVAFFEDTVLEAVADHPKAKYLLIVGDGINQLDASGEEVVHHLVKRLRGIGVELVFSGLKKQVLDIMRSTHLFDLIGQRNLFPTEDKAITAIYERLGDEAAEDLFCPVRQTAQ
ncbi:MAG: DNA repair protein [Gammaproteobacteria bacterium RIFOXYA12_FULL_61_12]|nr:MAG: DNA repair protein [Gammaproteobacteria bacterium RIFOXYD12_FULL_61_37]OGT92708.1 MAG: DNA repair protein [Gammaproteobacteria bacterium RIFOXYA12_FULL_61_12]